MSENAYPESLTQGIALARIHDLRRQAEQERLARAVRRARRSPDSAPAWPAALVAALRDSLAGPSSRRTPRRGTPDACVACA